ncbi:MAG: Ppx/GppA phosphatase family protein [Pseudomonadota bacterium]
MSDLGQPIIDNFESSESEVIAAIDLGSNSFHMVVASNHHGHLKIIDRLREMVRLSAGLNKSHQLDKEAINRALECLERFGQRLREMHADSVRAIGTNALRSAKDPHKFLNAAQKALGHPIEIISGIEEARLVYQGTIYTISRPKDRRIVIDIGGGSTEIIVGEGPRPLYLESLSMGCVSMSEQFFHNGKISRKSFDHAVLSAKQQLRPYVNRFLRLGWDLEIGTSGTIKSILKAAFGSIDANNSLTMSDLAKLRDEFLLASNVKELNFSHIRKERLPVLPGGFAVLYAIFENLKLNKLDFSDGALREGVLYDLLGRLHLEHEDVRIETVQALERRYHIDYDQANRVELSALMLFRQVKKEWKLSDIDHEVHLRWAARLHEIGLDIAHSSYHRHGAYLLQHADMPGFAWNEQRVLACLVGCHRRKIRTSLFDNLHHEIHQSAKYLLVILRLAVLLNRDRVDNDYPIKKIHAEKNTLKIKFIPEWLDKFPLTRIDLEFENENLEAIGFTLEFS